MRFFIAGSPFYQENGPQRIWKWAGLWDFSPVDAAATSFKIPLHNPTGTPYIILPTMCCMYKVVVLLDPPYLYQQAEVCKWSYALGGDRGHEQISWENSLSNLKYDSVSTKPICLFKGKFVFNAQPHIIQHKKVCVYYREHSPRGHQISR